MAILQNNPKQGQFAGKTNILWATMVVMALSRTALAAPAAEAAGDRHTVAILEDGTLWAWGNNSSGQLGDGTTTDRATPTQIGSDANWSKVTTGAYHTVALKSDGTLGAWGYNGWRQLGNGSETNRNTPTQTGTNTNWIAIGAGEFFTLALKDDGSLWSWGRNSTNQLGDGS